MLEPAAIAVLALATLAGAAIQAATGFGFAIIAAPFFLAVMNTSSAITLLVIVHLVQTVMLVPGLWRQAPRGYLLWLALGGLVGCPLGLAIFMALDVRGLKLAVGLAILMAAALLIARDLGLLQRLLGPRGEGSDRVWVPIGAGIGAGILTAVLVMPGPPLMVALMSARMSPAATRALSLTFFGGCYAAVIALQTTAGLVNAPILRLALMLAPATAIGTVLGARLSDKLSEGRFRAVVLALLALSGVGALVSALHGS